MAKQKRKSYPARYQEMCEKSDEKGSVQQKDNVRSKERDVECNTCCEAHKPKFRLGVGGVMNTTGVQVEEETKQLSLKESEEELRREFKKSDFQRMQV